MHNNQAVEIEIDNLWLLFIATVPGKVTTPRIRLWRTLKGIGAVVLRDGTYLLPEKEFLREKLDELADGVRELNGVAYVFKLKTEIQDETDQLISLFDRNKEYAKLLEAITQFRTQELADISRSQGRRTLQKLDRDLVSIRSIDFFPDSSESQAEQALDEAKMLLTRQLSPNEPHPFEGGSIARLNRADYQNRVWATRADMWADRVASAWLIRNFIDEKAHFLWVRKTEECPTDALGFDFDGATFSHIGERVTFEVLLVRFALDSDPGLAKLGALIHFIDIGGVSVPEADGFETILSGIREQSADDDTFLAGVTPILNALYSSFSIPVDQ